MDREHAQSAMSSSSDSLRPAVAPRPLRILIADDDRDSVMLLMTLLDTEGHEARGIHDGQTVMPSVLAFDPDVVILDIHMPGLSGWEACRAIREKCGDARPLLIGVSGEYKKGADHILSEMLGFNHYLLKPYQFSEILRLIAPLRLAPTTAHPARS
jgi:DNA-binding response OmpR family regulator